jgi:hypothetical protein
MENKISQNKKTEKEIPTAIVAFLIVFSSLLFAICVYFLVERVF